MPPCNQWPGPHQDLIRRRWNRPKPGQTARTKLSLSSAIPGKAGWAVDISSTSTGEEPRWRARRKLEKELRKRVELRTLTDLEVVGLEVPHG